MKRINIVTLILSLVLLLNSCVVGYNYEEGVIDDKFEEIISALKSKDKEALISLFSVNIQNKCENMEEKAAELFEYFKGTVESYDSYTSGSGANISDGIRIEFIGGNCEIKTTEAEYHISIEYIYINEEDPCEEGIETLHVIKKDDGMWVYGPGYWSDYGINIDTKKVPDNANLSVGGRLGYADNTFAFCVGNTLMCSVTEDGKTTVSKIRKFNSKIPKEITYDSDTIYFKLENIDSEGSSLHSFKYDGTVRRDILNKDVSLYKFHDDTYLYYTLNGEEKNKGVYRLDMSGDEDILLVEGDISEFVFRHSKVYYVEGSSIKQYHLNKKTTEVLLETDGMEIYSLDIADDALYYCTSKDDQACVNKIDLTDGNAEVLYSGAYCDYLHTLPEGRLVFKTEESYQLMDLSNGSVSPLFAEYDLSELYVFDDKVFFNVKNDTSEDWYQSDTVDFDAVKIEIPDDLTD